jgi:hypothetical protein
MMSSPPTSHRELPVLKAFAHILSGVSAHWRSALKPALPWLATVALLNAFALKSQLLPSPPQTDLNLSWIDLVSAVIGLIAGSSIAVSWHQFILRDVPLVSVQIFRLDRTVWRYLGRIITIIAICFIPLLALMLAVDFAPLLLMPIIFGLFIQLAVFGYRMALTLPATAVDNTTFGIREALEVTRGNNLRILALIAITILMILGVLLAFLVVVGILRAVNPISAQLVVFVLGIPVLFFNTLVTTNMLTSLYGFFVERRDF